MTRCGHQSTIATCRITHVGAWKSAFAAPNGSASGAGDAKNYILVGHVCSEHCDVTSITVAHEHSAKVSAALVLPATSQDPSKTYSPAAQIALPAILASAICSIMFGVTAKPRFGRSVMNSRISCASALAAALLALPLFSFGAAGQIAVSSNDGKALNVNGAYTVPEKPIDDTVTIIDLGVSPPKVLGEVKAPSSVVGPPQNVAITPDESIALVAAAMKLDPADPKKLTPDNRLSVIDLKAKPPAVIATIETGLGPSGVSINRAGTLALVANANEGTVSILTIAGKNVTAAGKVRLDNPQSIPRGVAFSPDGRMALVTRYGDHKISVLSVDGDNVEDTKRTMTGGYAPYAIQVSPKGDVAVYGNQGGNTGDIDTINVIDLGGKAPRVVHAIDVGQIVEGLSFSNDGAYVAVTAQNGSGSDASLLQ